MRGRLLHLNLHPSYRPTWHVPTSQVLGQRRRVQGAWLGGGILALLIAALGYGPEAGVDPVAGLAMMAGVILVGLSLARSAVISGYRRDERLRGRPGSRHPALITLMLGAGIALAGLGREALLRQARAECLSALREAPAARRDAVLRREPYSGIRAWLIQGRGPRRCGDFATPRAG